MPAYRGEPRRVLFGILWIVGLLTAALAIFFLDRLRHFSRDTFQVVGVFPGAERLPPDAEVWVAGLSVGRVTRLAFLPASADTMQRLAITFELPEDVRPLLDRRSIATLRTPRMLSNQVIDISPGTGGPPLRNGDTIRGYNLPGVAAVISRVATLRGSANALADAVTALNDAAERGDADDHFERVQENFEGVQRELEVLTASAEDGSLQLMLADPATRASFTRTRAALTELSARARARRASVGTLREPARQLERHATQLSGQLRTLQELADSTGFFGRMGRDTALLAAVAATQAQLDSLIAEAKKNPLKYVF